MSTQRFTLSFHADGKSINVTGRIFKDATVKINAHCVSGFVKPSVKTLKELHIVCRFFDGILTLH